MNGSSTGTSTARIGNTAAENHDTEVLKTEVLIVGAGPTGLVLALWLARKGVRLRIIDKTAEAGTTSRALAVQARTLEFYTQLGIADGGGGSGAEDDCREYVGGWQAGDAHRPRRNGLRSQPVSLCTGLSAG